MKLWEKGYTLDQTVETFMTSDDPILDRVLIPYDCLGSMAHAKMLHKIGILKEEECHELLAGLKAIYRDDAFSIQQEDEDVHTAIENALGNIGKKIHTARSRNDQILVDMRLYMKDQLLHTVEEILNLCSQLCIFAEKYQAIPIPGRTHMQRAMPSSLGLWAGAFVESLLDDIELLKGAYDLINQCPLGSGASYGVSLPIDRQYTAKLLGFAKVQNNVLYANNSRGKFEAAALHALVQVMNDLSKMATDTIFFSIPEIGYISLPEKFCPGSSLMPQKRNPCPLELIRAKSATLQGSLFQVLETIRALPSGYNRDFQETKRPVIQGFEMTLLALKVFSQIFAEIKVNEGTCNAAFSPELFATDYVLQLVYQGMSFRDAYRDVAKDPYAAQEDPVTNILRKTHLGATGNLRLPSLSNWHNWLEEELTSWKKVQDCLMGP